jgi:hypothetical protein
LVFILVVQRSKEVLEAAFIISCKAIIF